MSTSNSAHTYDDYEICEEPCVICGGETRQRMCGAIGCDDGYVDMYEYDDPLWYDPGDYEVCSECHGYGNLWWCVKCGADQHAARKKAKSNEANEHRAVGEPTESTRA